MSVDQSATLDLSCRVVAISFALEDAVARKYEQDCGGEHYAKRLEDSSKAIASSSFRNIDHH
jgi:hypothetical protein